MRISYIHKNIRLLMVHGFSEADLRYGLCFYELPFRALFDQLPLNSGKSALADQVIEWSEQHDLVRELLIWAQDHNPTMYQTYLPYSSEEHQGLVPDRGSNESAVNVLFVSADASDMTRLRSGQEHTEIQNVLRSTQVSKRFVLHTRFSATPQDVVKALLSTRATVVHFSTHGAETGELFLEDLHGRAHPVQPSALAALFEQVADQVECVVFSACFSEAQSVAVSRHVRYVIGMDSELEERAAIAFSVGFYEALASGRSIEKAYEFGRVQMRLWNLPGHQVPVLMRRSDPG